jgi:hypothetical protein
MSFSEGTIKELAFLRNRLRNLSSAQYNRQSDTYLKYLRDILIRYVALRYSVIIHSTIDNDEINIMIENRPEEHNEIKQFNLFFNKLENLKRNGLEKDKLENLYDVAFSFFKGKSLKNQ